MQVAMERSYVKQELSDNGGEEWSFTKVANKIKNGNASVGKNIMIGQVSLNLGDDAASQIDSLVAEQVLQQERDTMSQVLRALRGRLGRVINPKVAAVRRRMGLLNLGAKLDPVA